MNHKAIRWLILLLLSSRRIVQIDPRRLLHIIHDVLMQSIIGQAGFMSLALKLLDDGEDLGHLFSGVGAHGDEEHRVVFVLLTQRPFA